MSLTVAPFQMTLTHYKRHLGTVTEAAICNPCMISFAAHTCVFLHFKSSLKWFDGQSTKLLTLLNTKYFNQFSYH